VRMPIAGVRNRMPPRRSRVGNAVAAADDFTRIGAAGAPQFSRDGAQLFHLRGAGLPQLWVMALAGGAARQLTFHDEKVALLRRSPVDDRLIYGIDRGGDERQQLLLLDPAQPHPEARPLTSDPGVIHDFGGWSPDGTRIAYAANDRDEAHFDVHVQDLATGDRQRVYRGTHIVSVAGWRADGAQLAVIVDRGYGDMSLLVIDLAAGAVREIPQSAPTIWQTVRWSGDGRALLGLTDHGGTDYVRLCRVDPEAGTVENLYAAPGRDVEAWAVSPDTARLVTIENDRGWSVLRIGPIDGGRHAVAGLPHGVIAEPTFSAESARLAVSASSPIEPSGLWLVEDGAARPLWQPDLREAGLDAAAFVNAELVSWETFDGSLIPGWLLLPRARGPRPGVIWVHGGPVGQARPNFRPDLQMLVDQGFAVLMTNVRGSSGYGRRYAESDDRERRLDSVADLAAARHWLAAHPAIDAARIGVMGQSYGGFMVLSAITGYPSLWRAAVDYYGIADFATLLAGTGAWRRRHRAAEYGDAERDGALFARISPIGHVDRVQAPLLVLHGRRDPRVPIGESEQFVAALRERGKIVEYEVFEYAGHGFVRPDDRRRVFAAVARFFKRYLCS
jgi:dipeptidyl aminopeptidase/acylaminoacyl peptidase